MNLEQYHDSFKKIISKACQETVKKEGYFGIAYYENYTDQIQSRLIIDKKKDFGLIDCEKTNVLNIDADFFIVFCQSEYGLTGLLLNRKDITFRGDSISIKKEINGSNIIGYVGEGENIKNQIFNKIKVLTGEINLKRMKHNYTMFEKFSKNKRIGRYSVFELFNRELLGYIKNIENRLDSSKKIMNNIDKTSNTIVSEFKLIHSENFFNFSSRLLELYGLEKELIDEFRQDLNNSMKCKVWFDSNELIRSKLL